MTFFTCTQNQILRLLVIFFCFNGLVQLSGANYHWVGGSGNWSDLSHWVTTSGGNVNHAQVPTSNDNVIFDRNSFSAEGQTINFNTDIIFFQNMDWTDVNETITLSGGKSVIINAFGSIIFSASINFEFNGLITLNGDKMDNILNFGTNKAGNEIYFAGIGAWQFKSNIEVDSIFQIVEGNIFTNGFNIRTRYFYIETSNLKSFDCTNSEIEVWGSFGDYIHGGEDFDTITAKINTTNLSLVTTGSTFLFTAPMVEIWFIGDENINLNDFYFNNSNGRNRIRPWQGFPTINYNTLSLLGSSRIEGQHNTERLELARNKIYRFQDGLTYNINEIVADATCSEGIIMTSLNTGSEAIIQSNSDIDLSYITLRDIHAVGANFRAQNSTDLGNNNNWNFTNSELVDYYWIGGSGDWTDPAHWSLTSGGMASGCVPSGKDNAFFDQNSFSGINQKVTANIANIFIHDVTWMSVSGNPELTGDQDYSFHITGSLRMERNMQHTFGGYYYFESTEAGNTIEMNGQLFNRELEFSGRNADWTFLDDVYVHWNLTHKSGSLSLGGNNLNVFKYESFEDKVRNLDISGSHILLRDVADENGYAVLRPEWNIENENFSLKSDNSTIEFQTVHFGGFRNTGPNTLDYNNVVFSSYGGELLGNSYNIGGVASRIDSCIFHRRGLFFDNQEINYLYLTAGFDYEFSTSDTFKINELDANGDCSNGLISIYSRERGRQANFILNNDHTLNRLSILDFNNQGSGNLVANSSLDLGNNIGWSFNELNKRTLYWVGNTGAWEDPSHWSLSSGGPGGECIPTAIDDVFFDENSFTEINQSVYSDNNRFLVCHSMFWNNVFGHPTFGNYYLSEDSYYITDRIKLYGSLDLDSEMNVSVHGFHFASNNVDSVNTHGNYIGEFVLESLGDIVFQDDLNCSNIRHESGDVEYASINVNLISYDCYNANELPMSTKLNNSTFNFGTNSSNADYRDQAVNHQFDSDNSIFYFHGTSAYLTTSQGNKFNKIIATNPTGTLYIGDRRPGWDKPSDSKQYEANYLRFAGNGFMQGEISTDTLIGSAGKSYTLESAETQLVNSYLQLIGNNCTPIELKATEFGNHAIIQMPPASDMLVNFVEMRDNSGVGGAEFIAGSRSTNIGLSNLGWVFDDPPEYVETGFLGVDRALCLTSSLELSAFNFSPNENYLWNNGSTDTILSVTSSGAYAVTVTFDNGCTISDEIVILEPEDLQIKLPGDTIICEGNNLLVDGNIGLQATDYFWNDLFDRPAREISEEGFYKLTATKDGCSISDSFTVVLQEIPYISLGQDTTLCHADSLTLGVSFPSSQYLWYDNSSDSTHIFISPGTYWVESRVNGCAYRDTINIRYIDDFIVELGNDTIICEGADINLNGDVGITGIDYNWNNGSADPEINVNAAGTYILEASINQCFSIDSIVINFQPKPLVDLGQDRTLCYQDTTTLMVDFDDAAYLWQDMTTGPHYYIESPGLYWVEASKNNCYFRDSILINYIPDFQPQLGSDTIICSNESITLSPGVFPNAQVSWSNGQMEESILVSVAGSYIVNVNIEGCEESDTIELDVQNAPDLELGDNRNACEGDVINLSSNISADVYNWDTGASTSSIDVTSNGIYGLAITDGNCIVFDSVEVQFNIYPVIDLGSDTSICSGESFLIDAGQIGAWQDGTVSNTYQASVTGKYIVQLDNEGCVSSDSIYVIVKELPNLDLGEDLVACTGDVLSVAVPENFIDFMWDNGSNERARMFQSSTSLWLEVEDNGCRKRDSMKLIFNDLPGIELGFDTVICSDANYTILPSFAEGEILWPDGSNNDRFLVTEPGTIVAVITNNGCESRDSVSILFRECVYFQSYIPNVFSPNFDGNNDYFKPQFDPRINILDYSLNVFDRWGSRVFSTNDLEAEWDGNHNGSLGGNGVYVYFINIIYEDDNGRGERKITGDISLIR